MNVMKKLSLSALLLATAVVLPGCSDSEENGGGNVPSKFKPIVLTDEEKAVVAQQNAFSFGLFTKIAEESDADNIMVSPLSASMCLSMLANGADGETRAEILDAIGFGDKELDAVNRFNSRIAEEFAGADRSTTLSLANSLWIDNAFPVYDSFIAENKSAYGAEIFNVELTTEKTRKQINAWASDKTNGLISEFLKDTLKSPCIFLMNALYFKGFWTDKFDKSLTAKGEFHNADGSVSQPMMMNASGYEFSGCYDDKGATWGRIPYGNGAYELLVVLPDEGVNVTDYLAGLTEEEFAAVESNIHYRYCGRVSFPKFTIESDMHLNDVMKALGMQKAFIPAEADFSRMSNVNSYVSFIKQATSITFDEEGTEAAAVTGIGLDNSAGPSPSNDLIVDRAFAFMIRESSTGSILFMGAVNKL